MSLLTNSSGTATRRDIFGVGHTPTEGFGLSHRRAKGGHLIHEP